MIIRRKFFKETKIPSGYAQGRPADFSSSKEQLWAAVKLTDKD